MDTLSSVKMTALAASQYSTNANENTKAQLMRHTEVLLALLKTKEVNTFLKNSDASRSCISSLMDVLAKCSKNRDAICTIIKLFSVIYDLPFSHKLLFRHIDINSILMKFIVESLDFESFNSLQECLQLLEKTTQKSSMCEMCRDVDRFLQFILEQVLKDNSKHAGLCLAILSNLVSSNIAIQAQIKGMLSRSDLKRLINYLRQDSIPNKIAFLSIVTFICWEDDVAKNFFSIKNVTQTMKLLFSQLVTGEDIRAQQRAGNICIELLKRNEIAQQFTVYDSEHNIVYRLLLSLQKDVHPKTAAIVLQVLVAFCQVTTIRHQLCLKLLESDISWPLLFRLSSKQLCNDDEQPAVLAITLIAEVCEEISDSNMIISDTVWFKQLLSLLVEQLAPISTNEQAAFQDLLLSAELAKKLKSIHILKTLSSDDKMIGCIAKDIDHESLCALLDNQMSQSFLEVTQSVSVENNFLSSGVVLSSLELISGMKSINSHLEKLLYSKLEDPRLIPFLANALTGCDRSQLQFALKLHQEALPLPNFQGVQLAETIGYINEKRHMKNADPTSNIFTSLDFSHKRQEVLHHSNYANTKNSKTNEYPSSKSSDIDLADKENIYSLIASMQTSDDEPKKNNEVVVSGKTSEIVTIYENKISSLLTNKNNLQDLLEAKSLALSQADRIINQHRIQLAKSEEDARKMAEILRTSETCCERLTETLRTTECDRTTMERDLQTVVEENRNLQKVADHYDKMQVAFQDNMHKNEVLERNLKTSRQEYDALKELHDMIQKHNEKLKKQHGQMTERLEAVEDERMKLLKRVSELESSVSDLTQLVEEQDRAAQSLLQEKNDRDNAIKIMKVQLNKYEEVAKDLRIKESQLGRTLLEKEEELAKMKQTLETQAQTLSMITELANSKRC